MTVVAIIIEGNKTSARSKVKKCEAIEKTVEYSKKLGFKINIKLSAIDMRYLWLDLTSSFPVRILILWREVEYFF